MGKCEHYGGTGIQVTPCPYCENERLKKHMKTFSDMNVKLAEKNISLKQRIKELEDELTKWKDSDASSLDYADRQKTKRIKLECELRNMFKISCLSCRKSKNAVDCEHYTCIVRGTCLSLDDDPCEEWLPSKIDIRNKLARIKALNQSDKE